MQAGDRTAQFCAGLCQIPGVSAAALCLEGSITRHGDIELPERCSNTDDKAVACQQCRAIAQADPTLQFRPFAAVEQRGGVLLRAGQAELEPYLPIVDHLLQLAAELEQVEGTAQLTQFAIDQSSEAAFWCNDDGGIFYVNQAACKSLGYGRQELLQLNIGDIDPEWSARRSLFGDKDLVGCQVFESRHQHKNGDIFPVEITANLIEYQGRRCVCAFASDITQRHQLQQQQQDQVQLLESMERIDSSIRLAANVKQMLRDMLKTVYELYACDRVWLLYPCDPEAETFRVPVEHFRPQYPGALVLDEDIPMSPVPAENCRRALSSSDPYTIVLDGQQGEYEKFDVLAQMVTAVYPKVGKPWLFGLHQCSYPRLWTEQEKRLFKQIGRRIADGLSGALLWEDLKKSEERFRSLVESSSDWIWEIDRAWNYTYCSPTVQPILGCSAEEMVGENFIQDEDQKELEQLLQRRRSFAKEEIVYRHRRGGEVVLEASGVALFDSDNAFIGYRGVHRDISDRKLSEQEKQQLQKQLHRAQKLEAVGQLAGGVAHDFNNLLTAILGNLEITMDDLRRKLPDDKDVFKDLKQVKLAAERAARLTRQLLVFSRRGLMHPAVINVNNTLLDMKEMLRRLISENIKLDLVLEKKLGAVYADAGQIEQVILNLVVNARDAMPDGGALKLETANVVLGQSYVDSHADAKPGPHVLLAVADTGCGMDSGVQDRIFEPFFTTKPTGEGTGLGLATVYGIVNTAGGHLVVHSQPQQGTAFKIYLPVAESPHRGRTPVIEEPEMAAGSGTILVCEDDRVVRNLAVRILKKAGYTVVAASDGSQALDLAQQHSGPIHLLLTDVIMPGMNGKQLADALETVRPKTRILFTSGYSSNIIAPHGVLEQGVEFLQKPFTRRGLLQRVQHLMCNP